MFVLFLHLAHFPLELDDLFQRIALGLFRLRWLVVGALFGRRGLQEGVRMGGGDCVRRDHQLDCFDLPGGFHLAQMPGHIRGELVILQQLHRLGADSMQQVDPTVDGGEVHVESARKPFLADAFVDGAPQHVMLLHRREAVDPVVVGVGLEVLGDQAGRRVLA